MSANSSVGIAGGAGVQHFPPTHHLSQPTLFGLLGPLRRFQEFDLLGQPPAAGVELVSAAPLNALSGDPPAADLRVAQRMPSPRVIRVQVPESVAGASRVAPSSPVPGTTRPAANARQRYPGTAPDGVRIRRRPGPASGPTAPRSRPALGGLPLRCGSCTASAAALAGSATSRAAVPPGARETRRLPPPAPRSRRQTRRARTELSSSRSATPHPTSLPLFSIRW